VKGADCGTASEKFPPRDIPPLTPYVWAEDPDCDLGVVSQALMLASKARMNRMIKVLIEFIQDHPLYFVFSQDSTPLRSVPMFPYKKLNYPRLQGEGFAVAKAFEKLPNTTLAIGSSST